ncbi:MAG: S1-like domain-containing RNA-binding protein [Eubacteriales bacterium]|nr:S1-like domain-containing RNA-binding protein [Eubacteriales bacterium]
MNSSENENKAYPCDEPETNKNYPCDTDEAFSYAEKKGKGKRGGNAAASVVVHSGNFKKTKEHRTNSETEAYPKRGKDTRYENADRNRNENSRGGRRPQSPEALLSVSYETRIEKTTEVGAFVTAPDEIKNSAFGRKLSDSGLILLPFAEQLGRPERGTIVKVYFYEDKGGRIAATMRAPILRDGEVGILTVAAVTRIGAFLDNGVPKQILLPFKEQIVSPEVGDEVLVWLYSDKSGRQAATMRVYGHLEKHSPYKEDDRVTGFVYEINQDLGIFVAVDNKYYGLVPIRETFKDYAYGDEIEARVAKVREDGKLDLLIRDKLYKTVQEDADVILYELKRNNGFLNYGDRADAAFIEETYAMSKNQFKRALGHLYKNHIVELDREKDTVRLIKNV